MSGRPGSRGRVNAAAPAYVDGEVDGEVVFRQEALGGRLDTWRESDLPGEPDQGCVVER